MHRTRNAEYSQGYRGFESPPLRHTLRPPKGGEVAGHEVDRHIGKLATGNR